MRHLRLLNIHCTNCFKVKEVNASILPFLRFRSTLSTLSYLLNRKFSWKIVNIFSCFPWLSQTEMSLFKHTHMHPQPEVPLAASRGGRGGPCVTVAGAGPGGQEGGPRAPSLDAVLASLPARDAPTRGARTPSCLAYVCRPLGPTTCVLCRVANPLDFRAMDLSRLVSPGCGSPRAGPGRCASGCAPRLGAAGPGCPAPVIKRRLLGPGPELGMPAAGCPSCSLSGVRAGTRDRLLRGALGRVVWLPPPPRAPRVAGVSPPWPPR